MDNQDEVDARRYRWLRAAAKEIVLRKCDGDIAVYDPGYEQQDELDKAIDQEMKIRGL